MRQPFRQKLRRCLRKTQTGGNPQMRCIVLQQNQHNRRQRHHPQQQITVICPRRQVRGPVAGVDKADGNQKPRSQVTQKFACLTARSMLFVIIFDIHIS